ncbi:hypothetical protein COU80_05015 [Candidatus Peregrinibacteria bacterium CG10_big_fil_rev_8_21_14_0_10_55_24]|nr:MAG: hypothetical protein COU80_05015 [Candidatus Peregrinibacteria bacterium CG10_big_fil_rev_8_21_14_0_10_55_24]
MPSPELDPAAISRLVAQAQEGDTAAFGRIYDHFFPSVYRYAALRAPSAAAEDLTEEIFVKAWEKLYTYKPRANVPFGAWLFRIARHEVIDAYRTTRTWEEVPEELCDTDEFNQADTRVKRAHLLAVVRKTLAVLPRRYREVLELSYLSGLSTAEVAKVLKTSEGSIRVLKFRALKRFRDALPPEFAENM